MKIPYIILAVLFAIFVIVQFNDPDPLKWVVLYGFAAGVFGAAAFGKYNKWLPIVGIVSCLIATVVTFPGFIDFITNKDGITLSQGMSNEYPYIELAREFGGSLITIGSLLWLWFREGKMAG